jgi:PAS domain S-box-containing protein
MMEKGIRQHDAYLTEDFINENNELVKENSVFYQVWNKAFDGMRLVDKNGVVIFVNDALCRMFEKERNEMIGEDYTICYDRENKDSMLKKQRQRFLAHTIEPRLERLTTLWNGKKVWFDLSNSFITDERGEPLLLSIFRDITPRKDTEEKLKELLASKDKFFSIIAHDLKSPFQGLIGFSNILRDDYKNLTPEEIREFSGNISKSANSLLNLLQNLLEWSRMQTGKMDFNPQRTDIYWEIKNAENILVGNAVKKGIKINNFVPEGTFVTADRNMVDSICQNLLTNAIKFTKSGGEITFTSEAEGDFIKTTVSDTGVGIREEDLEKLFRIDVSHTTKGTANEKGTGLGLLLLKDMVEKHSGRIWVESVYGRGSRFMFTLPAAIKALILFFLGVFGAVV